MEMTAYGYVNGNPVYSRDEYIFAKRHFGPIETDEELLKYAEKRTHGWYSCGWKHSFTGFYLGDYALDEPKASLTAKEYDRLKELQNIAIAENKRIEAEKEWKKVETFCYADNSVEELWRNKYGDEKMVMTVSPHGDAC